MNKNYRFSFRSILIVILSMIIFYSLISIVVGIEDVSQDFSSVNVLFIPPIIGVVLLSIFFRSLIQKTLLNQLGIRLSITENFSLFLSGLALILSPGGSGQIIKSYFLKEKHDLSISRTIPVIFFERYYDLIAVTVLILISILIVFSIESVLISSIAIVLIFVLSIAFRKRNIFDKLLSLQKKIKLMKKFEIDEDEFYSSTKLLSKSSSILKMSALTILITFWDGIAIYMGFLAFGIDIGYFEVIQFYYTSIMLGVLSFIPGGIGIVEGGFTLLSSRYLEISLGVSIIIFIRLTNIWFVTFLGIVTSFRKLFKN